jgi:hypothetical protein
MLSFVCVEDNVLGSQSDFLQLSDYGCCSMTLCILFVRSLATGFRLSHNALVSHIASPTAAMFLASIVHVGFGLLLEQIQGCNGIFNK